MKKIYYWMLNMLFFRCFFRCPSLLMIDHGCLLSFVYPILYLFRLTIITISIISRIFHQRYLQTSTSWWLQRNFKVNVSIHLRLSIQPLTLQNLTSGLFNFIFKIIGKRMYNWFAIIKSLSELHEKCFKLYKIFSN